MLTLEQLAMRRRGIGSSDVPAILGLSRYKTPFDIWCDKTQPQEPQESSEAAIMGNLLEPEIFQRYQMEHPDVTLTEVGTVQGPESWMLATPDRIAIGADYTKWVVEAKTRSYTTARDFGEPGTDQVPPDVMAQVLWQMHVTGLTNDAEVALLVNGREFRLYRVRYDRVVAEQMVEKLRAWWHRHVVEGIEPEPTGASGIEYLRDKWEETANRVLTADPVMEEELARLSQAKRLIAEGENMKELATGRLMASMEDATHLLGHMGRVSWSFAKPRTVTDWQSVAKALGADLPSNADLVALHTTQKDPIRTFRFTPTED